MTDGVQRVFGMEYRPIQALEVLAPAGLKVQENCIWFLYLLSCHGYSLGSRIDRL